MRATLRMDFRVHAVALHQRARSLDPGNRRMAGNRLTAKTGRLGGADDCWVSRTAEDGWQNRSNKSAWSRYRCFI
jgi:hypothetical protein